MGLAELFLRSSIVCLFGFNPAPYPRPAPPLRNQSFCLLKSAVSSHSPYRPPPTHPPDHPEPTGNMVRGLLIPASHDAAFLFKVEAAEPKLPSDNPNTDGASSEEMLADGKAEEER